MTQRCFYEPGALNIIDVVKADDRSQVNNETLEEIRLRYPKAELWDFDAACEAVKQVQREAYVTAPVLITEERYMEMLEILPPVDWTRTSAGSSFKLAEFTCVPLTAIFAFVDGHYLEMCEDVSLPHNEIIRQCRVVLSVSKQ